MSRSLMCSDWIAKLEEVSLPRMTPAGYWNRILDQTDDVAKDATCAVVEFKFPDSKIASQKIGTLAFLKALTAWNGKLGLEELDAGPYAYRLLYVWRQLTVNVADEKKDSKTQAIITPKATQAPQPQTTTKFCFTYLIKDCDGSCDKPHIVPPTWRCNNCGLIGDHRLPNCPRGYCEFFRRGKCAYRNLHGATCPLKHINEIDLKSATAPVRDLAPSNPSNPLDRFNSQRIHYSLSFGKVHKQVVPILCEFCPNLIFVTRDQLKTHYSTPFHHYRMLVSQLNHRIAEAKRNKKRVCGNCGYEGHTTVECRAGFCRHFANGRCNFIGFCPLPHLIVN